jgi:D-beta-D-heptose 7-phosphate kinase/D-beta-D-heptose 1-phosphate adenosyltransferase
MQLPPLAPDRATQLVFAFPGVHILVVGDAMLDTFIVGRVTRISPEAPVPVVAFAHETHRVGGAANVAHNVTALGGHATLIAVMGQDDNSTTLMRGCREAGIEAGFIATDSERVTTTKVRIVTERNQQVARVDYENDAEISGDVEDGIIQAIEKYGTQSAAIVVSDYLKGCVTKRVMAAAIDTAKKTGIPVLVDPKIPHIDYYEGATVITPNHHEAEVATHSRIRSVTDARLAAHAFRDRVRCESILMTRGDQGMWLLTKQAEGHLPALAREVADVTGAGDTVIATLALAMAAGGSLLEAAHLANQAASIAVGKFGAATVSPAELLRAVSITADA